MDTLNMSSRVLKIILIKFYIEKYTVHSLSEQKC
jgi:hypothetical protein